MQETVSLFVLLSFVISACGPGQLFGPTFTPSPTNTSTPTITPTSTQTLTPTLVPTQPSTNTPIPPSGLGVRTDDVVNSFTGLFTFRDASDVDGNPAHEGVTEEGFTTMMLVGEPYVEKAELRIDLSKENLAIATSYWILFLEVTSHGGKEAADWVRDNFRQAVNAGKVEKVFGKAKVILESNNSGSLFLLTILPAESQ